jgi:hypothetical protein
LDFGIDLSIDFKKVLLQSEAIPNKLLQIAGKLGLIYPEEPEQILKKKRPR